MGLFRKKKRKNIESIQSMQESLPSSVEGISEADLNDGSKIQHFVLDRCQQIIETARELEEEKAEYKIVTEYLNDIQTIEELPEKSALEIQSAAENIWKLDKARDEYKRSEKRISDVQFVQMQQEEDRIPDAILRLQTNETYQNTVKRDMNYLESEKTEWYYNKLELVKQQKLLKTLSFALLSMFVVVMAVLMVLQFGMYIDTTSIWMIVFLVAALGAFGIFIKMSANQKEIQRSEINMNHAIVLLNKIKFKYVNVTNAVEYAREKYHVNSSQELNYLWEQYLNEVKEREKYHQTNEDLEYFNGKLLRILKKYRLYDARVWLNQTSALIEKKEMVEVKHNLIVRRQKLRSRIEYNTQNIRERRMEIDKLLKKKNIYTPEIQEIIESIDRISGLQ
ncbi:MAG: hypothetical protein J6A75_13055 [Lachnospiraceae bacterium]|nr:hypothetical protein [Lachnospiraceae bacterium]